MIDPKMPETFVNSLLAEDALLNSGAFDEHRRDLLARFDKARAKEKRARRITLAVCGACLALTLGLFATAVRMEDLGTAAESPEWVSTLLAMGIFLTPLAALLILSLYIFSYQRELVAARKAAYEQTLLAFPRQISELRKELAELRLKLGTIPGEPSPQPCTTGNPTDSKKDH